MPGLIPHVTVADGLALMLSAVVTLGLAQSLLMLGSTWWEWAASAAMAVAVFIMLLGMLGG